MKTINLEETCVFLQLNVSRMGDKRGVSSDEIEVDADKNLVMVRKIIFKSAAFDRIKSLDSEIRRYVRSQAFPFEAGMHLIPLKMVDQMTEQLVAYKSKRDDYIQEFANILPTLGNEAKSKLRTLHKDADYNIIDIFGQFSMSWQFLMIVSPTNLEQVSSQVFKIEQAKLKERMNEAFEEARMLLRETCLNLVSHLRFSLESDPHGGVKRLSASTVRHLQEFLNSFDLRNVTNDAELTSYVRQLKSFTSNLDAESLRTMDGLRHQVRANLEIIENSITQTMVTEPTRRIRVS